MGNAILLTGEPRSGKTTLILELLPLLPPDKGGFFTQEIKCDGDRLGFKVVTLDGTEGTLAHIDLASSERIGKYGIDTSVVDSIAAKSIEDAITTHKSVIVIDEIGPMEMVSDRFCTAVLNALNSNSVVVGTIVKRSTPFSDVIKSMPRVSIIEISEENWERTLALLITAAKDLLLLEN